MRALNALTLAAALAFSAALAVLLHYRVDEVDVFWQLRAGEEILSGLGVQHVDTWSHTRAGAPWHNIQWLSCVLLSAASRLAPAYKYLPSVRMAGATVVFFLATLTGLFTLPKDARRPLLAAMLAVAAMYSSLLPWLKLQPELFALGCYAGLLATWGAPGLSRRARVGLTAALLVLWANLHAGTAPIGAALSAVLLVFSAPLAPLPLSRRFGLACAALLCCLLSPAGVHGLQRLGALVLLYDWDIVRNPSQASLSILALLDGDEAGTHRLWVGLTLAVNIAYWLLKRSGRAASLPATHSPPALFATLSLVLTLGAAYKMRARPYQLLYYVPVATAVFSTALERLARLREGARQALTVMFCIVSALLCGFATRLTFHELSPGAPGFGLLEIDFPDESLEFIRRVRPQPQMHNTWRHGGYLIENLREYPVLFDSREDPFMNIFLDRNEAFFDGSAEAYAAYHHKYDVNFSLVPIQPVTPSKQGGYFDPWEPVFPRHDWALVFFDRANFVFVRRIVEHEALIARSEYKVLYHGLPADHFALAPGVRPEMRLAAEAELNRCNADFPKNVYCHWGKAAFLALRREVVATRRELRQAMLNATSDSERAEVMMSVSAAMEHPGLKGP